MIEPGKLLENIYTPQDLKKLDKDLLGQVCQELRDYIIDYVSLYGGHFGASLGVVELTVALHYVFDTPDDKLVWDVGHQAYGHKIITGRRAQFHTNRLYGGLSGFPKIKESDYDAFGVGHSSTSISATLGMAIASVYKDENRQHIAVIGDGALTGGIAFEAMNHAGISNANILIILNDNKMSIDPNVGALKDYLLDISTSQTYNKVRGEIAKLLLRLEPFGKKAKDLAYKIENTFKSFILESGNLFQSLNIRYFGPIDGHDIDHLVDVLNDLKSIKGPKILHVCTVKGKGYAPAEKNQTIWHAPGLFDKVSGEIFKAKTNASTTAPKYQDVFGHTIVELANLNEKIMAVTPAMLSGSSLNFMMDVMPDRVFDVDIAEQHAVTFSAGLAIMGLRPFCNIYSTFMQRGYDQVVHDVCLQDLPVIFCLDRAGFSGADGSTHHGTYDLVYMRCLPNMIVSAPMNEQELRNLMYIAQLDNTQHPFTIRYPRGSGVMAQWQLPFEKIKIGTGRIIKEGETLAVLSIGHVGNYAIEVAKKLEEDSIHIAHYDMRFVKPLDEKMLHQVFQKFKKIVTIEDGCVIGGFGSAIVEFMADHDYRAKVVRLGIPDRFVEHGTQLELQKECGFDADALLQTCKAELTEKQEYIV